MPNTLPGFLIAAGLVLFVFSLFDGAITIKGASLPSLNRKGRITLMVFGPILMLIGGGIYYTNGPLPIAPKPEYDLVNTRGVFKRVNATDECKAAPYTEIISNQLLIIGLESTTINTQHANLIIIDKNRNQKKVISISVGQSATYNFDSKPLMITITNVSECTAGYEINEL